ncbi:MAG TPA: alpha/beta hydrolase, partial [Anaeromyxobacteraceae bacterium]|nr:alpha/beta hydrolase [Anaeromyxobacteraceae bacterium]
MVLPGQYLERPALVAAGDVTLEALYHRGRRPPALLICPSLDGEGMDAPLLAEVAWAAARAGHASLRFQHRGRGASQGAFDPSTIVDDALAALLHLREAAGPVAAVVAL